MSYILEALKKADQERGIGAVPNLATPHEVKRSETHSYRWLWVVVTLLIVNGVLVVMLLQDRDAEVPVTVQALPDQQPPLMKDRSTQPVRQARENIIAEAPVPTKTAPLESVQSGSAGELVVLPEPASLRDSGPSLLPAEESPGKALDRSMVARKAAGDTAQLQSWYELPQEIRNRIDLPRLDLHAYSEEPQNRFILVKLKKYRQGERLESGLVLEEILPDGMVMSYRGERFMVEK